MSMTDKQVVEGAECMARELLRFQGYQSNEASIRGSTNPRAVSAWKAVTLMLGAYNGTDLQSAVDSVDQDELRMQMPPSMLKPKLRDFFYRIEDFNLLPKQKAAGFVLVVATEALARLHDVFVAEEEYLALQNQVQKRISRIPNMPPSYQKSARIAFHLGTAMPRAFVADDVFGGSIGADPQALEKVASYGADAVQHVGSTVEYTPHNCDSPLEAMMLHVVVQTWAEWAHCHLLAQDGHKAGDVSQ